VSSLTVPARFCGPPSSANGGYVAGRLALLVTGGGAAGAAGGRQSAGGSAGESAGGSARDRAGDSAVTVRLHRPPPLDRPLGLRHDGAAVELLDGETLVARAAPAVLDLDVPPPPGLAEAAEAAAARPPRTSHPFPTCFGCGPDRPPGESVRALLGPLPVRPDVWAGVWRPTRLLPASGGAVAPEVAWVALDCSSAQPVAPDDGPAHVLGTLTARVHRPVPLDREVVLLAWALGREGRKAFSASAVVGQDGTVHARARAVWIALT